MASRQVLSDERISRLILEEEGVSSSEGLSDSETEDNVKFDIVESDTQDDPSDREDSPVNAQERSSPALLDNVLELQTPPVPLQETSGSNPSILTFSRRNIRSRSRHVWATSKGHSSNRTAAINIVHVARGPTRAVRDIVNPLLLLEKFMTDQILEEILKWTNSEIAIRRQNYEQNTSTQNNTSKEEIRANDSA